MRWAHTPAYAAALAPVAAELRAWLAAGDRPYAGFSAGAAVAATRAVVGGWRSGGTPVCPEDAAEDLDEVTVTDGLGLVPVAVDVHCAQWGTLARLVTVVARGDVPSGVALDEGAMLRVGPDGADVAGPGCAWRVTPAADGVHVEARADRQPGRPRPDLTAAGSHGARRHGPRVRDLDVVARASETLYRPAQVMSASAKPRLAGRQPLPSRGGAPGEDRTSANPRG